MKQIYIGSALLVVGVVLVVLWFMQPAGTVPLTTTSSSTIETTSTTSPAVLETSIVASSTPLTPSVATTTAQVPAVKPEVIPAPVTKPVTPPVVTPKPPVVTPTPPSPVTSGITMSVVATHNDAASCWSVIEDKVYDLTAYVPKHPGGKSEILAICGRDGSSLFAGQHGGQSKPEQILAGYYKDTLAK